jgi:DNA-binding response OmpR family regulator
MFDEAPRTTGRRIVICDYSALLQSVTGVLRMSGYRVFQAQDGAATEELCLTLPDIGLLILNTTPAYVSTLEVIHNVRAARPDFPIRHIGTRRASDIPNDVLLLSAPFSADHLLDVVDGLFAVTTGGPGRSLVPAPAIRIAPSF